MKQNIKTTKDKLIKLEEENDRLCEDIAIYQNICVDELCMEYANMIASHEDKENILSLLYALSKEIRSIYFD